MTASVSRRVGDLPPMHSDPRAACGPGKLSAVVRLSFFPDKGSPIPDARSPSRAKEVCMRCPLVVPCGTWALRAPEPHGVWGGLSPDERRKMLRGSGSEGRG